MLTLPAGLIFDIARDAGIETRGTGNKRACRCPFHGDKTASAFLSADNIFFCSVCTPGGGWSAKRFCEELHRNWDSYVRAGSTLAASPLPPTVQLFTPADADVVWRAAFAHARDDDSVEGEAAVYQYIAARGLAEATELGVFGILDQASATHPAISSWPGRGYRIVAQLFDQSGVAASVQGRTILRNEPKTLVPAGTKLSGTLFADRRGQRVLQGEATDTILLGEGLTDMLALGIASPVPVFTAPGTGNAVNTVGPWARDRIVLLALDNDEAGNKAVPLVANAIYQHGGKRAIRIVWPAGAKDACDVLAKYGAPWLTEFLAKQLARRVA